MVMFISTRTIHMKHTLICEPSASSVNTYTGMCTGGHLIIGRTQLSDVVLFRALQMRICEI